MRHRRRRLARGRRRERNTLGFVAFTIPAPPPGEYWDIVSFDADGFTAQLVPMAPEPVEYLALGTGTRILPPLPPGASRVVVVVAEDSGLV